MIDHYIEFMSGDKVVRKIPVEAISFRKTNFCKPTAMTDEGPVPLCLNYKNAGKCNDCVITAKKLYKACKVK